MAKGYKDAQLADIDQEELERLAEELGYDVEDLDLEATRKFLLEEQGVQLEEEDEKGFFGSLYRDAKNLVGLGDDDDASVDSLEELLQQEDVISKINVTAQDLLIQYISEIAGLANYEESPMSVKPRNYHVLGGKSWKVLNYIKSPQRFKEFYRISPKQLSRMQPQVRVFKCFYDEEGNETHCVELRFEEYLNTNKSDPNSVLENKLSRGTGVGLKSFDWTFQGSNPATASKLIAYTMKIRLSSAADFDREYVVKDNNGEIRRMTLAEFLLPKNDVHDPNDQTLKVVVGWSPNFNAQTESERKLKKEIMQNRQVLILSLEEHDIDFRQNGTIILTLTGQSRIDSALEMGDNDIFRLMGSDIGVTQDKLNKARKLLNQLKGCVKVRATDREKKLVKDLEEKIERQFGLLGKEKTLTYSRLYRSLVDNGKVHGMKIPYSQIGLMREINPDKADDPWIKEESKYKFRQATPEELKENNSNLRQKFFDRFNEGKIKLYPQFNARRSLTGAMGTTNETIENINKDLNDQIAACIDQESFDDGYVIPFFFLGDLLDAALEPFASRDNRYNKKIKFLLGTFLGYDPLSAQNVQAPLAFIPISVDFFTKWFMENIFKSQKSRWPLKEFIKTLVVGLVPELLNTDSVRTPEGIEFNLGNLTLHNINGPKDILRHPSGYIAVEGFLDEEQWGNFDPLSENTVSYHIIHSEPYTLPDYPFEKDDIPKLILGSDSGLTKRIDYSRVDIPGYKELVLESNQNSAFQRIAEPYTAEVDMVGNNFFIPGQYVFLNPLTTFPGGVRDKISNVLKLKGIFIVKEVKNFIEAGKFETTITTLWKGFDEPQKSPNIKKKRVDIECEIREISDQVEKIISPVDTKDLGPKIDSKPQTVGTWKVDEPLPVPE